MIITIWNDNNTFLCFRKYIILSGLVSIEILYLTFIDVDQVYFWDSLHVCMSCLIKINCYNIGLTFLINLESESLKCKTLRKIRQKYAVIFSDSIHILWKNLHTSHSVIFKELFDYHFSFSFFFFCFFTYFLSPHIHSF